MEELKDKTKRIAIWGAGLYGSRLSVVLGRDGFDFYIDKNPIKKTHLGHYVVTPDDITDSEWKELYIYVPFNYYEEISVYLNKKGLVEGSDYISYDSRAEYDNDIVVRDLDRFRSEVSKSNSWSHKTVIWGRNWDKQEFLEFFKRMHLAGVDLAVVSEAVWLKSYEAESVLGIQTITAPIFFDDEAVVIPQESLSVYNHLATDILKLEVSHLAAIHGYIHSYNAYEYTVSLLAEYIAYIIDVLNIKRIICIGSVSVHHIILAEICRQKNIQILYTHQGTMPGTLSVDTIGEVGESIPALFPRRFCELPVSKQELCKADMALECLRRSGLNRKLQPNNSWREKISYKIISNRPIILYAGQNDVFSHMVPYTDNTKNYYSPVFKSSEEALFFLAEICRRNNWNLIFKPHPMYANRTDSSSFPDNVLYVPFGNINEMIDYCDVMITILSTANYISLIRKKPVVMLGYNQIKGKGCTYEAYEKDCIEEKIKDALRLGYTEEQQKAFTKHVAQSLKYYLYDDLQHKELEYGKKVPDSIDDFYELERLVKSNDLF